MKAHKFWCTLVCLVIGLTFSASADASALTLRVATLDGNEGGPIQVPLQVNGATNVGALQFDLLYDPQVLQVDTVTGGPLAGNALVDSNSTEKGRLRIGLATTDGLKGDGVFVQANFKIIGHAGSSSSLTIENARAWETPSHLDILVTSEAGRVNVIAASPSWWLIGGVLALVVLLSLLLVVVLSRRRTPAPTVVPTRVPPPIDLPERRVVSAWTCSRCGTLNPASSRFCGNCGTARV
jgi:hypothetical protein